MKTIIFCCAFLSPFVSAQSNLTEISDALRAGDANTLSLYMSKQVEINIGRVDDVYEREQAAKVLASFFSKYRPNSFRNLHHGASNSQNMKYYIGILKTNSGTFRSTILLEDKSGELYIKQFSLERE